MIRCTLILLVLVTVILNPPLVRAADWLIQPSSFTAAVKTNADGTECTLQNGLVRRVIRLTPGAATVSLDNLMAGESVLRSVRAEARLTVDGKPVDVGGLTGQPVHNYMSPAWIPQMKGDSNALQFSNLQIGKTEARFPWRKREAWISTSTSWPPPGVGVALHFGAPGNPSGISVDVHYELYDGLPVISKWLVIHNESSKPVVLNSMVVEQLAIVEPESIVDGGSTNFRGSLRMMDAFSDYSFGGNMSASGDAPAIHWVKDPLYSTQVNYGLETPCLLECSPPIGPEAQIQPGESFESFRVFELIHDSTERERRGLAVRRTYRAMAPWVNENPVLMHVRSASPEAVRLALDQCAEVGFEMAILTFGSGIDMENEKPEYLAEIKSLADYAHGKGIVLGGYSLLASRSINPANDAINPTTGKPGGARFGNSPCLESEWGTNYFRKLQQFYEKTGCDILENDGSYPGDVCASTNHPGHLGVKDSQWNQWKLISGFYQWCRARGIYLNVPDWYFLAGSSKTGMGYRETDWSLPRAQQEIIERQNIFDGTWEKTPAMGWMFVPLTEYQGGGEAATIEPLKDHLPHYETRLANLFGAGVQACYRGPRLFDADETRQAVKKWVDFYKAHRAILDGDLIHLRRPDGRDWDGWLHVNPGLKECGLAVFYNPLEVPLEKTIRLPLYYTGLTQRAKIHWDDGHQQTVKLERDYSATLRLKIPSRGRIWMTVSELD